MSVIRTRYTVMGIPRISTLHSKMHFGSDSHKVTFIYELEATLRRSW